MYVYRIYSAESKQPMWTYKTWRGVFGRLADLAAQSALGKVTVECRERFSHSANWDLGTLERIPVEFQRGPHGYGWQTPVGQGIPRTVEGRPVEMSAWSRSR